MRRYRAARAASTLGRLLLVLPPFAWLLLLFLIPFAIVLKLGFSESALAQPPYLPLARWTEEAGEWFLDIRLSFANYARLVEDELYVRAYLDSLRIAATSTALTLALGLPLAYAVARAPARWRPLLLMLVILPFWTPFLIRVYALMGLLETEGLLNDLLRTLGLVSEPLALLHNEIGVHLGIVYAYLPFMILPIYAALERQDPSLVEAALDLGARPAAAFWLVTVPLALPGIVAGCLLVFIPAVGEVVVPDLLGGSDTLMIGRTLWAEFFNNRDWPLASAVAVVLLIVLVVPIVLFERERARRWQR